MPETHDNTEFGKLVSVIESLQEHIKRDHATIGANETRTRNTLIDPLLKALGWADSSVITSEYLIRYGPRAADYLVADYALHAPGQRAQPIAFIEAKRMRQDLNDDHRNQALDYVYKAGVKRAGVKYAALTNGDCWELYEVFEEAPPQVVREVSIRRESAYDCAVQLLPLSNWDAEDFDDPASFEDSEGHETTEEALAPIPPSVLYPKAVDLGAATAVDMGAVFAWLSVGFIGSFIACYVIGFRAAQPVLEGLVGQVGAIVVAILVVAAIVLVWRFLRGFQLPRIRLWRVEGSLRKTLYWAGAAFAVSCGIGGFLGYTIGFQTAQFVYDLLAGVGTIVLVAIAIGASAIVAALLLRTAMANQQGQGRQSRRYRSRR